MGWNVIKKSMASCLHSLREKVGFENEIQREMQSNDDLVRNVFYLFRPNFLYLNPSRNSSFQNFSPDWILFLRDAIIYLFLTQENYVLPLKINGKNCRLNSENWFLN